MPTGNPNNPAGGNMLPVIVLSPKPKPVTIGGKSYNLIAFYFPDKETEWDKIYQAGFLGNFWPCHEKVTVTRDDQNQTSVTASFHTSEAAFQSLKWWSHADVRDAFSRTLTGDQAYQTSIGNGDVQPIPTADLDYTGLGRKGAMLEVVTQKFSQNPQLKKALLDTGDAYLIEHPDRGHDKYWSDGRRDVDGQFHGENWLGQTLMTVRGNLGGAYAPNGTVPKDTTANIAIVNQFANAVVEKQAAAPHPA